MCVLFLGAKLKTHFNQTKMSTYQLPDCTTMIECHRILRKTLLPLLFCNPAAAQGTPGRLVHVDDVIGCVMVDGTSREQEGVGLTERLRNLLKTTVVHKKYVYRTYYLGFLCVFCAFSGFASTKCMLTYLATLLLL